MTSFSAAINAQLTAFKSNEKAKTVTLTRPAATAFLQQALDSSSEEHLVLVAINDEDKAEYIAMVVDKQDAKCRVAVWSRHDPAVQTVRPSLVVIVTCN